MKRLFILIAAAIMLSGCVHKIKDEVMDDASYKVDFEYMISGKTVTFTNTSDSRLSFSAFTWIFGDGMMQEGIRDTKYTYSANGSYDVTLSAKLPSGRNKTCTKTVTIGSSGTTDPETAKADFELTQTEAYGDQIFIKDHSTGSRVVYDFGDGTSKAEYTLPHEMLIDHLYSKYGTYTVTCTAYTSTGASNTKTASVTYKETNTYITGIEYLAVDFANEYYRATLIDDDFFTTTWFKTNYTSAKLSSGNLPFTYKFANPVKMDGLSEDDYYTLYVYHSTSGSGDGTQCLKQNISKFAFVMNEPYIEVKNNSGNTVVHILLEYK